MNFQGTISRGIKAPIIKQGDDLVSIVADSVLSASKNGNFEIQDKDIIGVTESVLGKSQGNFATIENIAKDIQNKMGKDETVGLIFPIFSRNRFSQLLKGISLGVKKLVIMLNFPMDEVGNCIFDEEKVYMSNFDPLHNVLTEKEAYEQFGKPQHIFTGVDYVELYKNIAPNSEIIFSNKAENILKYCDKVINADIHTRKRTKQRLLQAGAKCVLSLSDILNQPVDGSGYHEEYGLLGSNMSRVDSVKLFPRDSQKFVEKLQKEIFERCGKNVECMVYGDGAFKDPVGKIWELADPVVSPGYTKGLKGTPNEIKLKYVADNEIGSLSGEKAIEAIKEKIKQKGKDLINQNVSLGTTPRQFTDLIGSLCDLTSGSGDKGTPIVLVQNYFKNYAD